MECFRLSFVLNLKIINLDNNMQLINEVTFKSVHDIYIKTTRPSHCIYCEIVTLRNLSKSVHIRMFEINIKSFSIK
jgi:hypothetical protein